MAITITVVLAGRDTYIANVAADGADVASGNIAHGLGAVPKVVEITPVTAAAAAVPSWAATTIDATNIVLTRDATGAAAATVRLTVRRPHSIGA